MSRKPERLVRCAVYTRKSTDEGLEKEFNTLDAQREAAEAYIKSQAHDGWQSLAQRYDDGGFTGGNMDRPALGRLIADIEAGRIDCVVVYKVDRLSRSLLDFARIIAVFDRHQVSFVSVTQQFNTATSMGRLILNVLLSFAQFERELISERTRDKMAATRRKGLWTGGMPVLGYNLENSQLVVNPAEAEQVRQVFELYLAAEGLVRVTQELQRRGWRRKRWMTRGGVVRGGKPFTKTALHQLLRNPIYTGQVRHKGQTYPGQHEAIVDKSLFDAVQERLSARSPGTRPKSPSGAPLRGLLRCAACVCAMTPAYSSRGQHRRYRYYACVRAQKQGWAACPSKSVPAAAIERYVCEQVVAALPELSVDSVWAADVIERVDYDGRDGAVEITLKAACAKETTEPLVAGGLA